MIHPQTVVHPNAKIGKHVRIDAFTTIEEDVVIGDNCWIGSNATIMNGARIGSHCQIFHGAIISAPPADLKFNGEKTTAEIGDHTIIREYVSIHRGTTEKMKTVIGEHCLIMAYSHVAHDCIIGKHCVISNSTQLAGHVTVGDHVIISGMCGVNQFVRIGDHAYIGAFTMVRKDVPPFVRAQQPCNLFRCQRCWIEKKRIYIRDHQSNHGCIPHPLQQQPQCYAGIGKTGEPGFRFIDNIGHGFIYQR